MWYLQWLDFYCFTGLLRDVTDDYEIVFYAASLSATIVSLNNCLLFILDKIFKTEANTDSPIFSISVISSQWLNLCLSIVFGLMDFCQYYQRRNYWYPTNILNTNILHLSLSYCIFLSRIKYYIFMLCINLSFHKIFVTDYFPIGAKKWGFRSDHPWIFEEKIGCID